jgi:hypothetical protein
MRHGGSPSVENPRIENPQAIENPTAIENPRV